MSSKTGAIPKTAKTKKPAKKGKTVAGENSQASSPIPVNVAGNDEQPEGNLPQKATEKQYVKYYAEQNIIANSRKKIETSDHTLSLLKDKVDLSQLHELLKSAKNVHGKELARLNQDHESNFEYWHFLLREGFNVMLYGVGSKLSLLDKFVAEKLDNEFSIVVHGFFPSLTIKQLLNSITEEIMDHKGTFQFPSDHAQFISQNLRKELYLVVHNIEGDALNSEKSISALCLLSKCPKIHILASVDHVNSGLIWDSNRMSCFQFLWFEVTNFSTYKIETAYENSFLLKQSHQLALSSLHHVFRSLTSNAQGIFLMLVRAQMDQPAKDQNGLTFKELYKRSREAFLVNSDLTLRTQLTEFKDHHMVRIRKGQDGVEYLQVTVDSNTLKQFLEEH